MTKNEKYTYGKKLLEKYGWKSGKGLGRNETGIAEALKPTLKFDKAGVGHNPGDEFSYHWWDHVFNKAASNIVVEHSEGGVKMSSKGDEDQDLISTNKWKLKKKRNSVAEKEPMKYGRFVMTSKLTPDGELLDKHSETSSEDEDSDDMMHSTEKDDALFKACEGRTAHKGARHGLTANGKLKRLEAQEQGVTFSSQTLVPEESRKRELNIENQDKTRYISEKKRKMKKKKSKKSKNRDELKDSFSVPEERDELENVSMENISNVCYENSADVKQEEDITEPLNYESCSDQKKKKLMKTNELNKNCHKKKQKKRKKHSKHICKD